MNKPNVKAIMTMAKAGFVKHTPEILIGVGIAGMITSTVLAVKATPKALEKIEEKKREVYDELDPMEVPSQALPEDVKLKKTEVIKATWKCYIPAMVTGGLSIACLIGASKVHLKRNAALATAYELSQTALTEYRSQVAEEVGEEKEREIKKKADERITQKYMSNDNSIVCLSSGETFYCIDAYGKQEFKANELLVREALVRLNNRLRNEMTVSLNDFYDEMGISRIPLGDEVGWYVNNCTVIEPHFDLELINGKPYIVVDFMCGPDRRYNEWR